jgi:hypothetical protein
MEGCVNEAPLRALPDLLAPAPSAGQEPQQACRVRSHTILSLRDHTYKPEDVSGEMRRAYDSAVAKGCGCEKQGHVRVGRAIKEEEEVIA